MLEDKIMILIPAKGKSRRIPNKNKQEILNKTLVDYAIIRSLKSNIGDVYLSSEDPEIIDLVNNYDNVFPICRPKNLSQDNTRAVDVCINAINNLKEKYYNTLIMTLPTSPLSDENDLKEAYNLFISTNRKPILSVTKYQGNNKLSMTYKKDTLNTLLLNEGFHYDIKSLLGSGKPYYLRSNGAVFICDISQFLIEKEFYMKDLIGFEMSEEKGLDINTPYDLKIATFLMEERNGMQ